MLPVPAPRRKELPVQPAGLDYRQQPSDSDSDSDSTATAEQLDMRRSSVRSRDSMYSLSSTRTASCAASVASLEDLLRTVVT